MKINLREEGTQEYVNLFQSYLDEVQNLNQAVSDELNAVMTESKYDRLQKTASELIDQYMETITHSSETGAFLRWRESEASLRACLELYQAGDSAYQVCEETQTRLSEQMSDTLKIEKSDAVITDRPEVTEDGFVQLEELFQTSQNKLQEITRGSASKITAAADENDIFNTLIPLIQGISTGIEAFFSHALLELQKLHESVKDNLRRFQAQMVESNMPSGSTSAGGAAGVIPAADSGTGVGSVADSEQTGPAAAPAGAADEAKSSVKKPPTKSISPDISLMSSMVSIQNTVTSDNTYSVRLI